MNAPNFLCLPDFVNGIPIFLDIFALNAEIPIKRFHENPPRFIIYYPYIYNEQSISLAMSDRNYLF